MLEKEVAQVLRYLLVDDSRAFPLLEQIKSALSERDWKRIESSFLQELTFAKQSWSRWQQFRFESSLERNMGVRAFWMKGGQRYTAKASVYSMNWNGTMIHLRLEEDVEEAGLKKQSEIRLPLMKNVKTFYLKKMGVFPLYTEGICLYD